MSRCVPARWRETHSPGEGLDLHDAHSPGRRDTFLPPLGLGPGDAAEQPRVDADVGGDEAHQRVHPREAAGHDQLVALGDRRVDADAVGARERGGVDAETPGRLEDALAAADAVGLGVVRAARVGGQR